MTGIFFLSIRNNFKNVVHTVKYLTMRVIQCAPHFLCYFFKDRKNITFIP